MNEEWPGQRLHQYAIFDRDDCMIDILQGDERLNINAPDRCGRTPVYTAVSNNSIKCLEILLQHGGKKYHNYIRLKERFFLSNVNHYHRMQHFDVLQIYSCRKHCEKRRSCL